MAGYGPKDSPRPVLPTVCRACTDQTRKSYQCELIITKPPWMTPGLITLIRKKQHLYNKVMKSKAAADWDLHKDFQHQVRLSV